MHSRAYAIGIGVGVLAALIFKVIYLRTARGRRAVKYDERQERVRGQAFTWAFWVLSVYTISDGLFGHLTGIVWADALMRPFLGFCLAGLVLVVRCIREDAYFSLRERPGFFLKLFAVVFVANLGIGVGLILSGRPIVEGGMLTARAMNFVVAAMFLVILLALGVKRLHDRRERDA